MRRALLRTAAAAVLGTIIVLSFSTSIVNAYVRNNWRWCDNYADITPNPSTYTPYRLYEYPVADAAAAWTRVGSGQLGGKVNFDFTYWYSWQNHAARIYLESDYLGINGTLARASWWGLPFCFGQGTIMYNLSYGFAPGNTTCAPPTSYYETYSVSLHELGHLVGLDHEDATYAIMNSTIPACTFKGLSGDDEAGIISIYGRR